MSTKKDVHLLNLCATSAVEWWHKMILLRPLLMYANKSPRSRDFQRECAAARDVLQWVRDNTLDMSVKQWSDKRLNDVLRTWRRAGYAFFALHEKGIRRAPWKTRRPKYEAARAFIEEARRQDPLASASNVHRTVNRRLARAAAATPSTVDTQWQP